MRMRSMICKVPVQCNNTLLDVAAKFEIFNHTSGLVIIITHR